MWYDFLIAGILIFCALRGAQKGFVWQIAGIAGLVLAFVCAETVSPHLMQYLDLGDTLNRWIAMLAVYIGASFVTFAVARSLRKSLEKAKFVEFDRHLGFIFGVLKGGLLAMVVSFFGVTLQTTRPVVLASYSGHASATVLNELKPLLPQELSPYLDPYLDDFEGVENPWDDGLPLLDASAADQAIAADDARRSDADPPAGPVTLDDIRTRFGGYVRDELSRILRGTTEAEGDRILAEVGDADPDDVLAVVDRLAAG
ncbi:MAG: CvpA family protein, partial [Planctomycetota bacterium]